MLVCAIHARAACSRLRTHERAKLLEVDGVRIIRVAFFHHLLQIVLVGLLSERLKDSSQLVFANRPVAILQGNIAQCLLVSGAFTRWLCLSVMPHVAPTVKAITRARSAHGWLGASWHIPSRRI